MKTKTPGPWEKQGSAKNSGIVPPYIRDKIKKPLTARAGANINRALMVRKIKAIFREERDAWAAGPTIITLDQIEGKLVKYASGQAARSKAKKGGL